MHRIFSVLSIIVLLAPGFLVQAGAIDMETVVSDRVFQYAGFSIQRFSPEPTVFFQHLQGADQWRERGILLVIGQTVNLLDETSYRLYELREGESQMILTPYVIPTEGCEGGSCPNFLGVGDRLLVMKDDVVYKFDPVSLEVEEWLDIGVLNTSSKNLHLYIVNEQIFVGIDTFDESSNLVRKTYWLSQPNTLERTYETAHGRYDATVRQRFDDCTKMQTKLNEPGADSSTASRVYCQSTRPDIRELVHRSWVTLTSFMPDGTAVGQIDNGIYLEHGSKLTRIGYSSDSINGMYRNSYGNFVAEAFGEHGVAWVGTNGALYVANIIDPEDLTDTGVRDVPTGKYPFRTKSSPTIYRRQFMSGPWKFETEAEYKNGMHDQTFSKVLLVEDEVLLTPYMSGVVESCSRLLKNNLIDQYRSFGCD